MSRSENDPSGHVGGDLTAGAETTAQLSLGAVVEAFGRGESQWQPSSGGGNASRVRKQASVAMILREREVLEVLLIERARRHGDRWSGQVAMPGGRREPKDEDLVVTAMRETSEEVGLRLQRAQWLAALGQVHGARSVTEMEISAELFAVDATVETGGMQVAEVANTMWVPLSHLMATENAVHYQFGELPSAFPGVLLPDRRNVLWGLTHRFIGRFLENLGLTIAVPASDSQTLSQSSDHVRRQSEPL